MSVEATLLQSFKENPVFFLAALLVAGMGVAFFLGGLLAVSRSPRAAAVFGVLAILTGLGAMGFGALGTSRQTIR